MEAARRQSLQAFTACLCGFTRMPDWNGHRCLPVVCVIAVSLLEFVIPQLTRFTIDHLIPNKRFDRLFLIGGGVLGAAIALGGLRFISTSLMASIGQKVLYNLRNDLYRHMQSLDVSFFDRNRTGDLMSRVTNDVTFFSK
ncbi:MAG: ABC transporter transmembrane domain-containing protein [Bacillota bacterium]